MDSRMDGWLDYLGARRMLRSWVLVGSRQWVLQKLLTDGGEKNTCSVCLSDCLSNQPTDQLFLYRLLAFPDVFKRRIQSEFSDPCSSCVLEKYLSRPRSGLVCPPIAMMMFIMMGMGQCGRWLQWVMQVMLDLVLKTGSCHSMESVVVCMTHSNNKRDVWVMQLGGNAVWGGCVWRFPFWRENTCRRLWIFFIWVEFIKWKLSDSLK